MSNFHVEQDEMVKFVGEMNHRIMQYVEVVEDIKAAFKAICYSIRSDVRWIMIIKVNLKTSFLKLVH